MPDELTPSSGFFTDVRGILADARRAAYTAVNSAMVAAYWQIRPKISLRRYPSCYIAILDISKIQNQQSSIVNPLFASKYRTLLPTEAELLAELERERRVIEQNQNVG